MENAVQNISNEDKMLSMLCHLSMLFGGLIMPIIIWAIKKDQSKFVRFHSLQSIFFHLSFSIILAIVIMIFAVAIAIAGVGFTKMANLQHTSGMPAVFMIIMFMFVGLLIVAIFGGIGYSIYLAVKSYQGEKIRIPILGKIIYERVYGEIR